MPSVGGPINEGEGQEKDLPAVLLAEQAHAELAALVIEEQQIARNAEQQERPPHRGGGPQQVVRAGYPFEQKCADGDGPGPNADPKKPQRRVSPYPDEMLERTHKRLSDRIVSGRAPEKDPGQDH